MISYQVLPRSIHQLRGAINTKLPIDYLSSHISLGVKTPSDEESSAIFLEEYEGERPITLGAHHPPSEVQDFFKLKSASTWLHTSHLPSNYNLSSVCISSRFKPIGRRFYSAVFIRDDSGDDTPKSPDFSSIKRDSILKQEEEENSLEPGGSFATDPRLFTYLIVGATGVFSAMAARAAVVDFLTPLVPSAATQATAQTELDLSSIPEGKNIVVKWRGKPVFIRHRTPAEIEEMSAVDVSTLRDPQSDSDRVLKPEWLVMIGICTHLGCVPIGDAGDYGGWYCPCQ